MSIPGKKWMGAERKSSEFWEGVQSFIRFTKDTVGADKLFLCPCSKCKLFAERKQYSLEEIHLHLIKNGFLKTYRTWIHHGEQPRTNVVNVNQAPNLPGNRVHCDDSGRGLVNMFCDLKRRIDLDNHMEDCFNDPNQESGDNVEGDQGDDINYKKRIEDSIQPLYPSCDGKHTKLPTIIELLSMKARHNCFDAFLTELLQFMKTILPAGNTLPATANKAKAMIETFRLKCEIIHAFPNDCVLYRKDYADMDECPNCKASRWKPVDKKKPHAKRVPMKKLRYFSVAERLQRMFSTPWIAELLNCSGNIEESSTHMRHPVDSPCWKFTDSKWPEFYAEKINVRLGLATDGFNPFGMNYPHNCWPVMLVPLNLPTSHCMAKEFTMLTLLVPGPTEPGHNIDVYLQPLVDELKELWSVGKLTYDSHTKSKFMLKEILMWCVHDFPSYGHVSGCRTSGRFGCPVCGEKTDAIWLKNGRKFSYMGHRRFLPADHPFRNAKEKFDGIEEHGDAPCRLTGAQLLTKINSVQTEFGKFTSRKEKTSNSTGKRRLTGVQLLNTMNRVRTESCRKTGKRKQTVDTSIPPNMKKRSVYTSTPWSKRSILFDLPYWEDLLVRHNLDVMHIEKNFAEIFFGTIMDNKDKNKDGIPARKDLQILKIKRNLWLKERGP
ncbi:uncharacterized protein LOC113290679 [Papaver somniferum]|uniref:uncharacterized protein LOC113290679 n=1 Tax=Papaver somniferum TaxID=3469 RepID=UPI000E6F8745|nr:uncharacterized protein LOC113290679 [Papaver somniferum]